MGNTLKRFIGIVLAALLLIFVTAITTTRPVSSSVQDIQPIIETQIIEPEYKYLHATKNDTQDEIRTEILYGELELLAQLVQAEAGNQDELGKRYVADCVLNRIEDKSFPDRIDKVIYQSNPIQFSCTTDGHFNEAAWTVTEDCFEIALEEYIDRTDENIVYFRANRYSDSGHPAFKHGDHYFSTK